MVGCIGAPGLLVWSTSSLVAAFSDNPAHTASEVSNFLESVMIYGLLKLLPVCDNSVNSMYGLFFEDINYAADGGLYAELVKNRSFDFPQNLMGWTTFGGVELKEL